MARSGLISHPTSGGRLSTLAASITHITAWQLVADAQDHGPTLIIHGDEILRESAANMVVGLMGDAFTPPFDLFFLNARHPFGVNDTSTVTPTHALLIDSKEPDSDALAHSLHGSAYVLHARTAVNLLQRLREDLPDMSKDSVYTWLASKLLTDGTSRPRAFVWDTEGELVERHVSTANGGGLLGYIWDAFTGSDKSQHRGGHLHK